MRNLNAPAQFYSSKNFNILPDLGELNDKYTYEPTAAIPLHLVNNLNE